MKTFTIVFFLMVTALFMGCKKDSDNPGAPTTSEYKGTWQISTYTYTGTIVDSLNVSLNMDGNNGALTGSGNIVFGTNRSGNTVVTVINGDLAGTYSDANLAVTVTDKITSNRFVYAGTKQTSTSTLSYIGSALIITSKDTVSLGELTFFKGN